MKEHIEKLIERYSAPLNIGDRGCFPKFVDDLEMLKSMINDAPAPAQLFTRTAYTKEELFAHIDSLEKLGFTSYVIGRDAEVIPLLGTGGKSISDRWIIKVYGTEEVEK